jgi:hypothetical protein
VIAVLAAGFLHDFMYAQYPIVVLAADFLYGLKKNGQKNDRDDFMRST